MVVQIHCVGDSHGPQRGIHLLRPMDGGMEHHHTGQQHDGLYGTLSSSVVVMSACASKMDDLSKLMKLVCEPAVGERRPIIQHVTLWYHAVVSAHEFKVVLGIDHVVSVQMSLEFDMDEPRCMIDEEATS